MEKNSTVSNDITTQSVYNWKGVWNAVRDMTVAEEPIHKHNTSLTVYMHNLQAVPNPIHTIHMNFIFSYYHTQSQAQ